jgi:hypothetical protein
VEFFGNLLNLVCLSCPYLRHVQTTNFTFKRPESLTIAKTHTPDERNWGKM